MSLVQQILKNGVILEQHTEETPSGCYEITKTGIVTYTEREGDWSYWIRYDGNYQCSENERMESFSSYPTAEEAALALIRTYQIIAIRHDMAIYKPALKPDANTCYDCIYYHKNAQLCVFNPDNIGNYGCPERTIDADARKLNSPENAAILAGAFDPAKKTIHELFQELEMPLQFTHCGSSARFYSFTQSINTTDYIVGSDGQKISVRNPFNQGGIEVTLRRWYDAYKAGEISQDDAEYSIRFDGVMVWRKWDKFLENEATRFIGTISDLESLFGDEAHLIPNPG